MVRLAVFATVVALAFNLPAQTAQPVEQFGAWVPSAPHRQPAPSRWSEAPAELAQLGASDNPLRKPEHTVSSCPPEPFNSAETIDGSQFLGEPVRTLQTFRRARAI